LKQIHFKNKEDFRKWLEKYHDKSNGIWMLYYKKHTRKTNIEYSDALDEALCFGWIDSIVKRIDDESYVRKFTPRKDIKNWSEINKIKVLKLIEQERMTIAGLQKIESYQKSGVVEWSNDVKKDDFSNIKNTPEYIIKAFKESPPAWDNFQSMSKGYRNDYIRWIISAKKEETRKSRLLKVVERLKANLKLGMM
jgi:uncharacterized protein YdeI (YjbR/CyaY-like superfamily)